MKDRRDSTEIVWSSPAWDIIPWQNIFIMQNPSIQRNGKQYSPDDIPALVEWLRMTMMWSIIRYGHMVDRSNKSWRPQNVRSPPRMIVKWWLYMESSYIPPTGDLPKIKGRMQEHAARFCPLRAPVPWIYLLFHLRNCPNVWFHGSELSIMLATIRIMGVNQLENLQPGFGLQVVSRNCLHIILQMF